MHVWARAGRSLAPDPVDSVALRERGEGLLRRLGATTMASPRRCNLCGAMLESEPTLVRHFMNDHGHPAEGAKALAVSLRPSEPGLGAPIGTAAGGPSASPVNEGSPAVGCLVLVVIVAVLYLIGSRMGGGAGDGDSVAITSTTDPRSDASADVASAYRRDSPHFKAYEACKDLVNSQLKAPGSASYPDYFDFDGEVIVLANDDGSYSVASHVDAENSFGGEVRTKWACGVSPVAGNEWQGTAILLEP